MARGKENLKTYSINACHIQLVSMPTPAVIKFTAQSWDIRRDRGGGTFTHA